MADNVKVNPAEVRKIAKSIERKTKTMYQTASTLRSELDLVGANWKDKSSYEFLQKFDICIEHINDFQKLMCKLYAILDAAATVYEQAVEDSTRIPKIKG